MKLLLVALVAGSRKLCDTTSSLYIAGCSSEVIVAYIMVAVFVKVLFLVALILDRVFVLLPITCLPLGIQ